jgi:hypothetical protein
MLFITPIPGLYFPTCVFCATRSFTAFSTLNPPPRPGPSDFSDPARRFQLLQAPEDLLIAGKMRLSS